MRPMAPTIAAIVAQIERLFWTHEVLGANLPR